jgi:hypothetical protein
VPAVLVRHRGRFTDLAEVAPMRSIVFVAVGVLFLAGCASGGSAPGTSRRVITSSEIEGTKAGNALQVIERLRAEFLRPQPNPSLRSREPVYPSVYVDAVALDNVSILRNIPASEVQEIRFLSASEAQYKYGSGHLAGVIEVYTKH